MLSEAARYVMSRLDLLGLDIKCHYHEEELFCQVQYFIDNDNGILSATKKENRQY